MGVALFSRNVVSFQLPSEKGQAEIQEGTGFKPRMHAKVFTMPLSMVINPFVVLFSVMIRLTPWLLLLIYSL